MRNALCVELLLWVVSAVRLSMQLSGTLVFAFDQVRACIYADQSEYGMELGISLHKMWL